MHTFNISIKDIKPLITKKTKAIVPVHLFGQSCDMEPIINFACFRIKDFQIKIAIFLVDPFF